MGEPPGTTTAALSRPPGAELRHRFKEIVQDPLFSAQHVRKQALAGAIGPPNEVTLRSLYWRLYLNVLPPAPEVWPDSIRRHRRQWTDLSNDYLRAPDGTLIEGAPSESHSTDSHTHRQGDKTFDPLGHERENPWPTWYKDLDLRRIVRQDVERTFPDNDYFRHPVVQHNLTNILFIFAKLHIDVGYRQGMHEIAAIILWCTDLDSLPSEHSDTTAKQGSDTLANLVLSRSSVVADTYAIYSALMTQMLSWYDPTQSIPLNRSGQAAPTLVQPIVAKCARIHDLLRRVDYDLWKRMEELQIEPQIYGLRWARLLFSREFPLADTLTLWDAMFAEDAQPTLQIVDYICLAMLLRIRESLLDADYSTFLQGLLRYPVRNDGDHRIMLLVQQAKYLCDNTSNFGGAYVRRQNQQLQAEAGVKSGTRAEEAMYESRAGTPTSAAAKQQQAGLLDQGRYIAGGLYERAEAMGINKALYSTFSELRKNVQAYQQQQQQGPLMSQIPSRPSLDTEPARNLAVDLKRLKAERLAMGNALQAALQILDSKLESSHLKSDEAVTSSMRTMQHIKEVLTSEISHFDTNTVVKLAESVKNTTLQEPSRSQPPVHRSPILAAPSNLLDDLSPTMAASSTFAPIEYPKPLSKPLSAHAKRVSISSTNNLAPSHNSTGPGYESHLYAYQYAPSDMRGSHQRSGSNAGSALLPNGPARSAFAHDSSPLPSTISAYPRLPPPSLASRQPESNRSIISPLTTQGEWVSEPVKQASKQPKSDPLGALF